MNDTTNPRDKLDAALEAMRRTRDLEAPPELITMEATVVYAEALSLLVDAHLPAPAPEPEQDLRGDLPNDTPVGHGWVVARIGRRLFKPHGQGRFTRWWHEKDEWGAPGHWCESRLTDPRPATVGDLRRVGLPESEWPEITAPEAEQDDQNELDIALFRVRQIEDEMRAWQLRIAEASKTMDKVLTERNNAVAALRAIHHHHRSMVEVFNDDSVRWSAYRECQGVVETKARDRGIELDNTTSRHEA